MAPRSTLTIRKNRRKVYEREGTVGGLEDKGQIALSELKQNCSNAAPQGAGVWAGFRRWPVARSRSVVRFCWGVR